MPLYDAVKNETLLMSEIKVKFCRHFCEEQQRFSSFLMLNEYYTKFLKMFWEFRHSGLEIRKKVYRLTFLPFRDNNYYLLLGRGELKKFL